MERGSALCEIAPDGETLVAEFSIAEKDAALLEQGQDARMLFTEFPHTRIGGRDGKLTWLSPVASSQGMVKGYVTLENKGFVSNGKTRELHAGMSGEVRIQTGRRTLFEYALQPLRQLKENLTGK